MPSQMKAIESIKLGRIENANDIINETEKMEAIRFNKLWNFIKNVDIPDRYPLLLSYHKMLDEIPDGERKNKIQSETKVPNANHSFLYC